MPVGIDDGLDELGYPVGRHVGEHVGSDDVGELEGIADG